MGDVDKILQQCVEDIWHKYDEDNSGELDKEEARQFAAAILGKDNVANFSDEDFDICFREFDDDGSGKIDKAEMVLFIKKVTGLTY